MENYLFPHSYLFWEMQLWKLRKKSKKTMETPEQLRFI